jgi:hypothetical protein
MSAHTIDSLPRFYLSTIQPKSQSPKSRGQPMKPEPGVFLSNTLSFGRIAASGGCQAPHMPIKGGTRRHMKGLEVLHSSLDHGGWTDHQDMGTYVTRI